MKAKSFLKEISYETQINSLKTISGDNSTIEFRSLSREHFAWPQRCFDVTLTEWKIVTYSHLMASTRVAPSTARQTTSPPAIPMITTSTSKTLSAPNWTTRWAHFTLHTSHGSSLTEVSQRLAAAALPSWIPAPAASKRRKSVPTPVRAFLGPSAVADSSTSVMPDKLGERLRLILNWSKQFHLKTTWNKM